MQISLCNSCYKRKSVISATAQLFPWSSAPSATIWNLFCKSHLTRFPSYFVKGKALHQAAAIAYGHLRGTGTIDPQAVAAAAQSADAEIQCHVLNAVTLLIENVIRDWEIVAIEEPFVMSLGRALPPCVGIIDLVLRRDDDFMIVEHKTGKSFYEHDELQLALYREYIRRRFAPRSCQTVIDEYRWVNDLGRIRKPAFQRQYVTLSEKAWDDARKRVSAAYRVMQQIATKGAPEKVGECFKCPVASVCRNSASRPSPGASSMR